ncbi:MAG TPA: DUF4423 domain-containing protein, partial [Myxococcota bacterium]|nr:DUF4423 domain-containing protein [Myxococcota bacterium]
MPKVRSPIWKKKSPAGDMPPIRRIEVSMRAVYPDITTCTNYRSFMKDWLRFMRRLNKKPEADLKEEFAVAAQSTNPSLWDHLVTSRTMTPELLPRVIRAMELESGEAEYFTLLVRHFQAERARQRATQRQERALGAHRAATASLLLLRTQVAQQPWDRKLHQALKTAEKREKNCLILLESSTELTCAATGALEAADSDRRAWLEVNQAKLLATNAGDYCTHWYIPALQALIECTGFQNDPTWIAHKLKGRVGEQEVMHGLRVLRDMKLIEEKNQRLVPTSSLLLTRESPLAVTLVQSISRGE